MGKQTNLFSFFKKAESPAKKPIPLKLTKVAKKVKESVIGDNGGYVARPVFVTGTLVAFDGQDYTVEFASQEIPSSPGSNSSESPSKSVASAHKEDDKTEENWKEEKVREGVNAYKLLGTKIAKEFDDGIYTGELVDIENVEDKEGNVNVEYGVFFEDGDYEDLDKNEFDDGVKLYAKQQKKQAAPKKRAAPKKMSAKSAVGDRSKRARKSNILDDASSDDDVEMMDKDDGDDDDDDEFDPSVGGMDVQDDDDQLDADMLAASEEEDDVLVDSEEEEDVKPAAKKTKKKVDRKPTKKAASTKKTTKGKKDEKPSNDAEIIAEFEKDLEKKMSTFKPTNNPQNFPKNGEYVEAVGIDPTYGIVEGIVAQQVHKVGKLLLMVKKGNHQSGELTYPIDLGTACSGTDAPSIALDLILQSLKKMAPDNPFAYEHHMSCEIEPFKQGYIARNFPGTTLYPDITKLSDTDEEGRVADVYGVLVKIPQFNLWIAGTSCKDFSMLKDCRKDIEDRGQSGETFLAAVEFLEIQQPPFAIFENVDGAPWGKMAAYIEGRISLKERNDNRGITPNKSGQRKTDADSDLIFGVNENRRYEVVKVPPQMGLKGGAIVQGVVKAGRDKNDVEPLVAAEKEAGMRISLGKLAVKHNINLEGDTLVVEKKARYSTRLVKVDTKDFGLPQTRNRKYLFIWRSDDANDDLGDYFEEILEHLKTPLLHSVEAFLLPDTHDRIRCFREALRSGPGLMVARERAKEKDFWDPMTQVKDTTLHHVFRKKNGIPERMRWLTNWDTRGKKTLAPGLWPELFDCWNMRRLDMIDCFAGAFFRDAVARDPNHHLMMWDISQNVTRAPFRSATPGVAGCVTPGGENVLPHKGRSLMGYEKLLLQGIPFSRLSLGQETEVQLSDLAGNAMSLSVVSATILAAICAPQLRKQRKSNKLFSMADCRLSLRHDAAQGKVLAERGDLYKVTVENMDETDFGVAFQPVLELADDAFRSSTLCTCESSGTTSKESKILQCSGCGWRCCHSCTDRYQTSSHDLVELDLGGARPDPHEFQSRLRRAAPPLLRLGSGAESLLRNGDGLESYTFQMQQVDRRFAHWQLTFGGYEDFGAGRQVAEMRVNVGRLSTLDNDVGVAAFIRCFAPAIRDVKPQRGNLEDSARLYWKANARPSPFLVPAESKQVKLSLVGSDPVKSMRATIGLDPSVAQELKNHKITSRFKLPIESRNPLTYYPSKWQEWPGTIDASGDPSNQVNGVYRKLECQHTTVLSAIWRRESSSGDSSNPMYLFYCPNVLRCGLDVAVFSPSPSYVENKEVVALVDWIPENTFVERKQVTAARLKPWKEVPELIVNAPAPTVKPKELAAPFQERLTSGTGPGPTLVEITHLSPPVIRSLLEYSKEGGVLDLFGKLGTQCAKHLSIVAAPLLLKLAAEDRLSLSLSRWYSLPVANDLGRCEVNVPTRPSESWRPRRNDDGFERYYDPEASDEYHRRLLNRPQAWHVVLQEGEDSLSICCNPNVAAHRARALLPGVANDNIHVAFQLTEFSSMAEPITEPFRIPNSSQYQPAILTEDDGLLKPLWTRQAKAVTRMIAIEDGDVSFEEEERSEHTLPGIDWCLIAKASRKKALAGGVLGDAMGSGKTVIVIGLILKQIQKARASSNPREGRSGATLIVMPPGILGQWDDEIKNFTGDTLRTILIENTQSLKQYTVEDLCTADVVMVPPGLTEERGGTSRARPYTENLRSKAGVATPIPIAPPSSSYREAPTIEGTWIRNMASGPEIYVGNKGSQKYRDNLAYYSFRYGEAVQQLRTKSFSPKMKGVPLEWFTWERVVIDECHETLMTGKDANKIKEFKDDAKRGAREFLGVSQANPSKRPLRAANVWGLSGTPLLETEARVTELANLCGNSYVTGAASHWRRNETFSNRDIFLNQVEEIKSREYRTAVGQSAHAYVKAACQRNCGEALNVKVNEREESVNMSEKEGEAFLRAIEPLGLHGYDISADQLGEGTDEVLSLTAASPARHKALLATIGSILAEEPETKVIVFATSLGYESASQALRSLDRGHCRVTPNDSVERMNEVIRWFRHVDVTEEDRARPRVLLLDFEQAAGHNLQAACHSVIMFDPVYTGTDASGDCSKEQQAIGRVLRTGQKRDVTITRIVLQGPEGQDCVDKRIVQRNTDPDNVRAATSNFD